MYAHRNIPNDEILRPETIVRSNTEKYYDIAFRLDGDVSEGASERSSKRAIEQASGSCDLFCFPGKERVKYNSAF